MAKLDHSTLILHRKNPGLSLHYNLAASDNIHAACKRHKTGFLNKGLSDLAACGIKSLNQQRMRRCYICTAIGSHNLHSLVVIDLHHTHCAVCILHTVGLIYTHPVETGLIDMIHIGIGSPRAVTYTLVKYQVEMLVEGPLSLFEI